MRKLYINLTDRNSIIPPEKIKQALLGKFSLANNAEWYFDNNFYETIFYHDNKEFIACLDINGKLCNYKINLPLIETPAVILNAVKSDKEIMNVVEIHNQDEISYEIILRDKQLIRYVAFVDSDGHLSEEKAL